MLKKLLKEINDAPGFSKSSVSKDLDIPEAMVDDLLEQLIRMNYLKEELGSLSCETTCNKCAYAKSCNSNPIKMFTILPKGKELLKNI